MAKTYENIKLLKHLDRLAEWTGTGFAFPIAVSLNITNRCNNFCPLCLAGSWRDDSTIPLDRVYEIVAQLKGAGIRAIGLGGGGDAGCHEHLAEIIEHIASQGIDVALYSNGGCLTDRVLEAIVRHCSWVRISLDADGPELYETTHGVPGELFHRVLDRIGTLVSLRRETGSPIVISTGYLLGPHTVHGVYGATKLCRELGVDHIRIRPFYAGGGYKRFTGEETDALLQEVARCFSLQDGSFAVSCPENRWDWLSPGNKPRPYGKCHGHNFSTIISANQKMYVCCYYENNEDYCIGDLKEASFGEIWASPRRADVAGRICLDVCPSPCILDDHNRLLWDLMQEIRHHNFI
jgi:MoaA/NifB/PqqE/SkfB family radical SAM enzyme